MCASTRQTNCCAISAESIGGLLKSGDDGEDHRACIGRKAHVAQVNLVEGRLAHAKKERAALFEADVGRAFNQV